MFAEPTWLLDCSVNLRCVSFGSPEDQLLHKDQQLEDYSTA